MKSHAITTFAPPHRKCVLELDLPRFRKRSGVSLDEIVQRTKISSRFLHAIEEEQFEELPGGIFSTSYLRQYAEAIGYDVEALLACYVRKVNPAGAIAKAPQRETSRGKLLDRWLRTAAQTPR
ncbi:MAG TPA: helix-turn-helix transcriptional regulator [Bryobacteraceae bacterium]|nr:helix-turn-helix transcriptional regulator [Bryobacteraceae bacterium]